MKNFTFRGSAHKVKRFFNIHHLRQKSVYTVYIYKKTPKNVFKKDTLHSIEWFTLEKKLLKNIPLV